MLHHLAGRRREDLNRISRRIRRFGSVVQLHIDLPPHPELAAPLGVLGRQLETRDRLDVWLRPDRQVPQDADLGIEAGRIEVNAVAADGVRGSRSFLNASILMHRYRGIVTDALLPLRSVAAPLTDPARRALGSEVTGVALALRRTCIAMIPGGTKNDFR